MFISSSTASTKGYLNSNPKEYVKTLQQLVQLMEDGFLFLDKNVLVL